MGGCLTKKSVRATSSPVAVPIQAEKLQLESKTEEEEIFVKKEILVIKQQKSNEVERRKSDEDEGIVENGNIGGLVDGSAGNFNFSSNRGVTAVRTSSCTKEEVDAILIQCGRLSRSSSARKAANSGTKRSYDFDNDSGKSERKSRDDGGEAVARERENRRMGKHRHHSQGRRRTPSREREKDLASQSRSGSRERSGAAAGRRVSRSPGRRSDSPVTAHSNSNSRPGKLVSVPATIAVDKSTNDEANIVSAVKRNPVKRNAGDNMAVSGTKTAHSPARVRVPNENQTVNLSRTNSRKGENSPYRRNPLSEIDTNIISSQVPQKSNVENKINGTKKVEEETKEPYDHVAVNVISSSSGQDNLKPQILSRCRSSRLSKDLDVNPDASNSSYTALLLEDIQNFHQKNNNHPPSVGLPQSVTKSCSIVEAVAGLNNPSTNETREPILEAVVVADDDLMAPSFHKCITMRREEEDMDDLESSGSNSVTGSQQRCLSPSYWEPNAAGSASSARTVSKQSSMHESAEGGGRRGRGGAKRRDYSDQQNRIGSRGRIGSRSAAT